MAARQTRVTLSIPWDDEERDHPTAWGWDVLLACDDVVLVDFEDVDDVRSTTDDAQGV